METSDKSARQLFEEVKRNPTRKRFGFGRKPALINVDLQKAYTKVGEFVTPRQPILKLSGELKLEKATLAAGDMLQLGASLEGATALRLRLFGEEA